MGLNAQIENNQILVGNAKILSKFNIQNNYIEAEKELSEKENSVVYIAKNSEIIAIIGIKDVIRENVKEVIQHLSNKKIETMMLTGDNKIVAEKIANEIGITKVIANVMPKDKVEVIKNLKSQNKIVMMCGDGINDSPALANSDIGVSINSGTDIAMDSSDVVLTNNNLASIIKLIDISKKTTRNIKQNLFWAFFYNILMIPIAIGALKPIGITITPMIASIAMVLSSVTVIFNALRLKE